MEMHYRQLLGGLWYTGDMYMSRFTEEVEERLRKGYVIVDGVWKKIDPEQPMDFVGYYKKSDDFRRSKEYSSNMENGVIEELYFSFAMRDMAAISSDRGLAGYGFDLLEYLDDKLDTQAMIVGKKDPKVFFGDANGIQIAKYRNICSRLLKTQKYKNILIIKKDLYETSTLVIGLEETLGYCIKKLESVERFE